MYLHDYYMYMRGGSERGMEGEVGMGIYMTTVCTCLMSDEKE